MNTKKIINLTLLAVVAATSLINTHSASAQKALFERKKITLGTPYQTAGGVISPKQNPDLIVKRLYPGGKPPGAPRSAFCGDNQGGGAAKTVIFGAQNKGRGAAGPFMVRVTFPDAKKLKRVQEVKVGHLPSAGSSGSTTVRQFTIPASAWKSGVAKFEMRVDPYNKVKEGKTGETNNIRTGFCVAPAT